MFSFSSFTRKSAGIPSYFIFTEHCHLYNLTILYGKKVLNCKQVMAIYLHTLRSYIENLYLSEESELTANSLWAHIILKPLIYLIADSQELALWVCCRGPGAPLWSKDWGGGQKFSSGGDSKAPKMCQLFSGHSTCVSHWQYLEKFCWIIDILGNFERLLIRNLWNQYCSN